MNISKVQILPLFREWINAWNDHNLDEVMRLFDEDVVFVNWTGAKVLGKNSLRRSWTPWFLNHGNFKFLEEDLFFDETEQKMLFMWRLEWPSTLKSFQGKPEIRRGVDIIYFQDGKIIKKLSYSQTTLLIEGKLIVL